MACLTLAGAYSRQATPALAAATSTTPRACPTESAMRASAPTYDSSRATASGACSLMSAATASWIVFKRRTVSCPAGVDQHPCATSLRRPPLSWTTPYPQAAVPGSMPTTFTKGSYGPGRTNPVQAVTRCGTPAPAWVCEAGAHLGCSPLLAGRRAWGPEDDHAVAFGDRDQPGHVRRRLEPRRQHPLGRRLADLVQETLELEGLEANQRLRSLGLTEEGVRHAFGAEGECARRQRQALLADVDGELALEHVEPLVLFRMNVPRRPLALADGYLEQA